MVKRDYQILCDVRGKKGSCLRLNELPVAVRVNGVRVGNRIRKRRQILKITQQELGKALGITPQHISAIEQDKWSPSLTLLPKLAEELGVTTDYLLSGKEGVIIDTIPAIKADKRLNLKAKRALIALVEELCEPDPPKGKIGWRLGK